MADRISSNEYSDLDELSAEAVDLVEITGVVKWFDVAKGFGFIVPDNGMSATLVTSNLPSTMTETLVSERLIGARMSARWLWRSDDRHNGDNYRRKSPAPKWTKPFS